MKYPFPSTFEGISDPDDGSPALKAYCYAHLRREQNREEYFRAVVTLSKMSKEYTDIKGVAIQRDAIAALLIHGEREMLPEDSLAKGGRSLVKFVSEMSSAYAICQRIEKTDPKGKFRNLLALGAEFREHFENLIRENDMHAIIDMPISSYTKPLGVVNQCLQRCHSQSRKLVNTIEHPRYKLTEDVPAPGDFVRDVDLKQPCANSHGAEKTFAHGVVVESTPADLLIVNDEGAWPCCNNESATLMTDKEIPGAGWITELINRVRQLLRWDTSISEIIKEFQ